MTLDDAIEHANDVVQKTDICDSCRIDHLQLREWLRALKSSKPILNECYGWFGALCGDSKPSGEIGKLMEQIEVWNRCLDAIEKISYNNSHEGK